MKEFRRILIVRTDRVGDVVLTTPAIAALRKAFPHVRLAVLIAPGNRELLEGNPSVDEILVDDRKGKHRGFAGFLSLVKEIKKRQFDIAFVFHTKKRTNLLCFWAGIPQRAGYRNEKLGFLLTHPLADTRPQGLKHESEYCLDVLRSLEIPINNASPYVPVSIQGQQWVQQFLKGQGVGPQEALIAIHPGASCISKRWMPERFAQVADELIRRKAGRVVFVGGAENREIMKNVLAALKSPVIDATGKTSLGQLAALLKRCRLLVSNDSGPVHMAGALSVPVISIFGRNQAGLSPVRWGPLGPKSRILHKEVGCPVCLAHNCQIEFKCLTEIEPREVLEAVDGFDFAHHQP